MSPSAALLRIILGAMLGLLIFKSIASGAHCETVYIQQGIRIVTCGRVCERLRADDGEVPVRAGSTAMQALAAVKMDAGTGVSATVESRIETDEVQRAADRVMDPLSLLPSQIGRNVTDRIPEVFLVLSVVDQAIHEYFVARGTGRQLYHRLSATHRHPAIERRIQETSAETWIFEAENEDPWSFRWCCSVLGYDAGWLRKKIREHRPRGDVRRARLFLSKIGIRGTGVTKEMGLGSGA